MLFAVIIINKNYIEHTYYSTAAVSCQLSYAVTDDKFHKVQTQQEYVTQSTGEQVCNVENAGVMSA